MGISKNQTETMMLEETSPLELEHQQGVWVDAFSNKLTINYQNLETFQEFDSQFKIISHDIEIESPCIIVPAPISFDYINNLKNKEGYNYCDNMIIIPTDIGDDLLSKFQIETINTEENTWIFQIKKK